MTSMMTTSTITLATIAVLLVSFAPHSHAAYIPGFVPGESTIYSDYNGTANPYPVNNSSPIFPTKSGPAGADDLLFQNLLSAEWIVYNFYQQGVEAFMASDFTDKGFKSTTYQRITEIRDNEAGHVVIFQNSISSTSVKPGPCKYNYSFDNDVTTYLVTQATIEIASMAFLTALSLQAKLNATKEVLVAIGETEARHLTWNLIDVWGVDPFAGPADTVYPYVNQILETTKQFIIPGSCPEGNPAVYPNPSQDLPQLANPQVALIPGDNITFTYLNTSHTPSFKAHREYYAVFFHGVLTISVPFDVKTSSSVIPKEFENKGVIISVIADKKGAPTLDSVVAWRGRCSPCCSRQELSDSRWLVFQGRY